jgi:hypothetical protein
MTRWKREILRRAQDDKNEGTKQNKGRRHSTPFSRIAEPSPAGRDAAGRLSRKNNGRGKFPPPPPQKEPESKMASSPFCDYHWVQGSPLPPAA